MTGARNLVGGNNMLMFMLPRAKDGINKVRIMLNAMDTYDVEFGRIRAGEYKTISRHESIYNDGLVELFERITGLYTSL